MPIAEISEATVSSFSHTVTQTSAFQAQGNLHQDFCIGLLATGGVLVLLSAAKLAASCHEGAVLLCVPKWTAPLIEV